MRDEVAKGDLSPSALTAIFMASKSLKLSLALNCELQHSKDLQGY